MLFSSKSLERIYQDKIIDGCTRARICEEKGINPRYRFIQELESALIYAVEVN
jgi:hypothetical protein